MGRSVDGKFAINIRALADVDFGCLTVVTNDGTALLTRSRSWSPPDPWTIVYHGNCHCGAVAYTLLNPEKISTVNDCDCSICSRHGALWTYPETTMVTFNGLDSSAEYVAKIAFGL
ncbi:hypothetical protein B0H13DRAFT_2327438 [Mycena leptocephala]|nr:hypothetical protein B0H13DRAFT_2327438 [Mycena leptocephala]